MNPNEHKAGPAGAGPEAELPSSVMDLIRQGDSQKIAAIRELREQRPGLDLAEAKRLVEEAGARHGTMSVGKNATKSGCFIATACLGDHEHPSVLELRQFRDDHLLTTGMGRAFVEAYYRWSPGPARWLAGSRVLRMLARAAILAPALALARSVRRGAAKPSQGQSSDAH